MLTRSKVKHLLQAKREADQKLVCVLLSFINVLEACCNRSSVKTRDGSETFVLASRARRDRPSLVRDPSGYTIAKAALSRAHPCWLRR